MFHVLYQLQIAICTGFMEETWSRNVLNILTTPVTEAEYILGVALFGLAKLVLAMAALTVMAIAFFGFNLASVGWGLLPITAVLLLAGWSIGMAVIGLMLRYGQSAEILAWGINFLVMALSGVFNPVDAIPAPLQPLSRILPTTHAFTALRTLLDGQPLPWDEIAAGVLGAFACAGIAIWYAARMLRTFRRRGFVTRFS
jgi:ABC-2 type transport system permease protein